MVRLPPNPFLIRLSEHFSSVFCPRQKETEGSFSDETDWLLRKDSQILLGNHQRNDLARSFYREALQAFPPGNKSFLYTVKFPISFS